MAFQDFIYLVVGAFVLIMIVLAMDYTFDSVFPLIQNQIPSNQSTALSSAWTKNNDFFNGSFPAIFFLFSFVALVAAAFISSNPVYLIIFIFINLVLLFVYDAMTQFLTQFMTSSLNTGSMNTAQNFVNNDLPKGIIVLNILLAALLYGRRGSRNTQDV